MSTVSPVVGRIVKGSDGCWRHGVATCVQHVGGLGVDDGAAALQLDADEQYLCIITIVIITIIKMPMSSI